MKRMGSIIHADDNLNVVVNAERPVCQTRQEVCDHKTCLYSWHVLAYRNMQSVEKLLTECGINAANLANF